ncbi:MAG TPA: tetratricopeptide repeat protein [Bacteroidia bacterium]|nr:tetratricopeptide repeat protein [Bacteroidia bacterium]
MKKTQRKSAAPAASPKAPAFNADAEKRLLALIAALIAALLYINTAGHSYTVDDGTVIGNNTITKKGVAALPEIFTSAYRAGFWDRDEGMYRPLSVAMFAVEYQIAPDNPLPGHLINILLYALTAYFLFGFLARLFPGRGNALPFMISLIFIMHPLHTEVVANIKSRDEMLCFFFGILSLDMLVRSHSSAKSWQLLLAGLFFFLALLSKESAITLLAVFPLTLWFFTDASTKQLIRATVLCLGVTALYMIIRVSVLGSMTGHAEQQLINNSLLGATNYSDQLSTALYILGRYLLLLIFPHPLVFDYSYNQIPLVPFSDIRVILSIVAVGFLVWKGFTGIKNKLPEAYGILFFFITLSLVLNILFLIESTMAERFLYMPSLGFAISAGLLISKWYAIPKGLPLKKAFVSRPLPSVLLATVLLLFAFKTVSRNNNWKDNLTLLSYDVKTSPNSARIRYAYGSALLIEKALKTDAGPAKESFLDQSILQLERGVSILPSYAEAWYHLGLAYKEKNNPVKSIAAFETARKYKTFKDADFYIASGLAYGMGKQYGKALADFTVAISKDPANAEAYNNKGLYFTEQGTTDSAFIYLNKAIEMKKDFYQALYNRGNTYAKTGAFNNAIEDYKKTLEIKPGYTDAILNLGNSYAAMGDYKNALVWFEKLLAAEPNNSKLLYNIGITYNFLGDTTKGNAYIRQAQGR